MDVALKRRTDIAIDILSCKMLIFIRHSTR